MEYIDNGKYKIEINGQEIVASAEELREMFLQIKKYENSEVNDYIETCPTQFIYENSARFELMRNEIKDDGWKDFEWSDQLEDALDIAMECAMEEARDYYEHYYIMQKRYNCE